MREIGISVYPDFYTVGAIKSYLKKSMEIGITKVFISFILGNHGFENAKPIDQKIWGEVLQFCNELGLEVSADINREVFTELGCSFSNLYPLLEIGVTKLRIDGGFTNEEIALITNNSIGIKVEINASLSSGKNLGGNILDELRNFLETVKQNGNLTNLTACHNFFPLPETALSLVEIQDTHALLKEYGIPIGAFVASQLSPKDLHEFGHGVCTIEEHRFLPTHIAMMELFANGVDFVFIGDSMAGEYELSEMARCAAQECIEIPVVFNKYVENEIKEKVIEKTLLSRIDQPQKLIRATNTRGINVKPCYCALRNKYMVSINNSNSAQYMGELQIALNDMGRSIEHNVIGFVHPSAERLLEYIKFGKNQFRIVEY